MTAAAADRAFLSEALALAALSERTSPNPRVGALLVKKGQVLGWGHHEAAGKPHAEALAARRAGKRARGATLYVNLEPCAHHGRTPPCTDLLVAAGIARVVASLQDPNPLVNGRGFDQLRRAGIEVETGLLRGPACRLNEPFLHWHATGRPYVTLKAAASLDGRIAPPRGESRWISGTAARRLAHRLRLRSDAILVGAETIRRDDPSLTVRLDGALAGRLRVVLSRGLDVSPDAQVFRPAPDGGVTRVYTATDAPAAAERALAGRATVVRVPCERGQLDLGAVLTDLAQMGTQSVLVEGGGRTWGGFLAAGLADRVAVFLSGRLLGSQDSVAMLEDAALRPLPRSARLRGTRILPVGEDLLWSADVARGHDG